MNKLDQAIGLLDDYRIVILPEVIKALELLRCVKQENEEMKRASDLLEQLYNWGMESIEHKAWCKYEPQDNIQCDCGLNNLKQEIREIYQP